MIEIVQMELIERIDNFTADVSRRRRYATDEAKTIDYLVQSFFRVLGYDPNEPEDAEREHKQADNDRDRRKADYVLKKAGKEIIVVEVKAVGRDLDNHRSQLAGYFENMQGVRFAVLTDGIKYLFYSDHLNSNTMDKRPFLEIHLELIHDWQVSALRAFTKSEFDQEKAASIAIISYQISAMGKLRADSTVEEYFDEVRAGRLMLKSATEFESVIMSDSFQSTEES